MKRITLPLLAGLLLLGACMDQPLPTALAPEGAALSEVPAGTCVVTSTADSGDGSLRAALSNSSCTTITFSVAGTIALTSGTLNIVHDLTIAGPGASQLTVERAPSAAEFRIFDVNPGSTATIFGLTISAGVIGGGIYNDGTLTLMNSTISGNSASGNGGGILNNAYGTLTLTNSTVSGNDAANGGGGGILNWEEGTLTLTHSTVSDNRASGASGVGGGILNAGAMTLTHSTVSGNSASGARGVGGGILNGFSGTLTLTHSTLSGNSAGTNGGGISNPYGGTVTLRNTIIANSPTGGNCFGGITDGGYNLDSGTTCGFTAANNSLSSADPQLGELSTANGGPTATHALLEGSAAINTGVCTDHLGNPVGTDQRGVSRPQGNACDIGAYEREQAAPPPTPAQLLESLITLSASTPGVSGGTNNKLLEARTHLNQGQILPACNKLREYISDVQSQRGKKITTADADRLIGMAQEVRAAIGC